MPLASRRSTCKTYKGYSVVFSITCIDGPSQGWVPLKTCQRKCGKKNTVTCKSDFPKSTVCIRKSMLVCRGIARKHKLKVTGRRNAFASILGKRTCQWQSGTTPAFAVGFRSNTHNAQLASASHPGVPCGRRLHKFQIQSCARKCQRHQDFE